MNQPTDLPTIDPDTAMERSTDAVLLDVRDDQEWMSGHAPMAVHIPLAQLPERISELDRAHTIVCICRSGNRSARATAWLRQNGLDAVNLTGGMNAWAAFGHPMINHAGNPGVVI